MSKVKDLFSTPRRAAITIGCAAAIVACIGVGSAYAAGSVAKASAIGEDNAKSFACADAGLDPANVEFTGTGFDFEQGQFVYEIEFAANGVEYEYWIKASDGSIVKKDVETVSATASASDSGSSTAAATLTTAEAKKIALDDAGLKKSDVTYTKEALDNDDGIMVHDLEFYTDSAEYEYEIDAASGDIVSRSKESLAAASSSAASSSNSGSASASGSSSSGSSYISLSEARSIALNKAGLSASEVTFIKAKKDHDDGRVVYEIDFYQGYVEYEVEIDATSGAIIDYDVDYDD